MNAKKDKNAEDCEVLIARSCGSLIAIPKIHLSAVKDFEETAILENLQKPLIGVAQNSGKAVLLADPKFILRGKRRKGHVPKYLIFMENKDRNISFQVDEIVGLKTISVKKESKKVADRETETFYLTKFKGQQLSVIKIETLLDSLMGKSKKSYSEMAVDFVKDNEKADDVQSFLSFAFEGKKFAISIENLNGVKPIKEVELLEAGMENSVRMVNFNDTICPFIGEDASVYVFQAFFSPPSEKNEGRRAIAIGSTAKCDIHKISSSQIVKTGKDSASRIDSCSSDHFKNAFEVSSEYGFDISSNQHLRVINLDSLETLKSLYPLAPKIKSSEKVKLHEVVSFLSVAKRSYNYLFPLTLLKKVSPISEIRITKNQNENMVGYTNLEGKVTAVFDLHVVLGGQKEKSNFIVFLETNDIKAGLAVPEINRVSISKNLTYDNVKENNAAMFQDVAGARIVHQKNVYYQIDHEDLQERLLGLSK